MPLRTVGLGGDGDEVDAIEEAFARFGLQVPVEDAPGWVTVGDAWSSVLRLAPKVGEQPAAWERFTAALCYSTGADPQEVGKDTRLLA